jgi:hypothetical protein
MKIFFAVILTLLITACDWNVKKAYTYTMNIASVVKSVKYVDDNIDSALSSIYDSTFYTVEEQQKLDSLVSDTDVVLRGIEKIMDGEDKAQAAISAAEVDIIILDARRIYTDMYGIVAAHYTEYTSETQASLKLINDNLVAVDKAWIAIVTTDEGKDVTPIVKGALQAIGAGIQISKIAIK